MLRTITPLAGKDPTHERVAKAYGFSLHASLLLQRPEVVRYLVVHELAHTRHPNHSTRFWLEVERHEPAWRALDRKLVQGWRRVPRWVLSRR